MDAASELIGSEVVLAVAIAEGSETAVPAAAGEFSAGEEAAGAGGGAGGAEPGGPGVMLLVALAQFALYPSMVFSAVGLMANAMPD
jgi:hypothetical protein